MCICPLCHQPIQPGQIPVETTTGRRVHLACATRMAQQMFTTRQQTARQNRWWLLVSLVFWCLWGASAAGVSCLALMAFLLWTDRLYYRIVWSRMWMRVRPTRTQGRHP